MSIQGIFKVADHLQASDGGPLCCAVHGTDRAVIVAWTVKPSQRISPHVHTSGQDTWTILGGEDDYYLDANGQNVRVAAGNVVAGPTGAVYRVLNTGAPVLVFASVSSRPLSGFEPL